MKTVVINLADDGRGLGRDTFNFISGSREDGENKEEKKDGEGLIENNENQYLLIELGELVYFFNKNNRLEDIYYDEDGFLKAKATIEQFAPEEILLCVHGILQDITNCLYMPFGQEMLALTNYNQLADILYHLTKDYFNSQHNEQPITTVNINLIMCYGARTIDYQVDHAKVLDFYNSFAYNFLAILQAKYNLPGTAKPTEIHMVAYTGEVSSELQVESETGIYMKRKRDQLLQPYASLYSEFKQFKERVLLERGEQGLLSQEYKDFESRIDNMVKFKTDLDLLCNEHPGLAEYGAINFHSHAEGITCQRAFVDSPCDRALIDEQLAQIQREFDAQKSGDRGHCITM